MARPKRLRFFIVLAVALLIPVVPFVVVGEVPGEHWLSSVGPSALRFGLAGAALLGSDALLPVPSSVVGALLGARLGFLPGWLWAWTGLVAGNAVGYAAGRLLFARVPPDLPPSPTWVILFVTRPVPVLAEGLTLACGAARMDLKSFLAVTALGNGLYAAALAASGATFIPGSLAGPGLAVPMLIPALAWVAWQRLSRRRAVSPSTEANGGPPCST